MKKRTDGRYCKQVLVGYQPDGKRKMKAIYGKTIREVEMKERKLRRQIESGECEENCAILQPRQESRNTAVPALKNRIFYHREINLQKKSHTA